jgi:hypothetical protein
MDPGAIFVLVVIAVFVYVLPVAAVLYVDRGDRHP